MSYFTNPIVSDAFGCLFEMVIGANSVSDSRLEPYLRNDLVYAQQFISHLNVEAHHWPNWVGGMLSPNDIHQHISFRVARLVVRGAIRFYKLPRLQDATPIAVAPGQGVCFMPSVKNIHIPFKAERQVCSSLAEAEALVNAIPFNAASLASALHSSGVGPSQYVGTSTSDQQAAKNLLTQQLAGGAIWVYKVAYQQQPTTGNAPPVLVSVTDMPGNRRVPLAPEPSPAPAINTKKLPSSIGECEKRLLEARKKLDDEGYKPKYTDRQLQAQVKSGEVAGERFLVSFQTKNTDATAKLAHQRDSGLVPIWSTSFDQLENADTDPELIAAVLGTPYDPSKDYVLHIIDRGENMAAFGQDTFVPTWEKMRDVSPKLLKKHDSELVKQVLTPEYQKDYASNIEHYKSAGLGEFDGEDQAVFVASLEVHQRDKFSTRHAIRTEIGANSEFTGNGLTQSRDANSEYGVVETLTLERDPPSIINMNNVKTIDLKPRGR